MHIDTKTIRWLSSQLRLIGKDAATLRHCLQNLSRLRSAEELQALATHTGNGFDLSGMAAELRPALLEQLSAASKQLAKNAAQLARAVDSITAATVTATVAAGIATNGERKEEHLHEQA
jgi:hypothetical protein